MIDKLLKLDWSGLQKAGFFILALVVVVGGGYMLHLQQQFFGTLVTNDLSHFKDAIERQSDVLLKLDSSLNRQSVLLETYLRK